MEANLRETVLTKLQEMKNIPVADIQADDVKDYCGIRIDKSKTTEERVLSLIEQTGNPYVYRDGGILVKVSFAKSGKTLQSCMEDYLTAEILLNR